MNCPPSLTLENLRKPHPSIPHNPLIAEPMFLTRYAEKAGSGILDMMQLCREGNLLEPEFRQDGGQFVQTIWRPKAKPPVKTKMEPGDKSEVPEEPESSTSPVPVQFQSLEERILRALKRDALPVSIISTRLGQKRVSVQLKVVLKRLVVDQILEFTLPDKPNSRLQKYRLTEKGRGWLERG